MSAQLAIPSNPVSTADQALLARTSWLKTVDGGAASGGLQPSGSVQHFAQDREIYGEGDNAGVFFKVVSGVIRTCKFLSDGRRQIDAFHVAGDIFGFEMGWEHTLSAEAVCDCTVIPYRRRGIETANDEVLSQQLFTYAMRSFTRAQEHSLLLGRRSAVEKVAAFLIEWAEQSPAGTVVSLAMTRQDIADYLGLTIETVSRTLSQLERDALIELPTARQIRLKDMAALQHMNA
ncbi:helix-turn-helix domain-containing protein [Methyloferula stellata]|uniref:helix-turn-helix domain-containing protein n=1 Tax=Methyloferula stellata TaxID=876270 RepID=UPI00037B9D85|nr:helix-turn-helix domain-containing protein [Methyloferula stellata]